MKYKLRNFQNNFQAVASLGWVIVIASLILMIVQRMPGFLIFMAIGALLIMIQLRGKRVTVNTYAKTIKSGGMTIHMKDPQQVYLDEVRVSQNVNSRVSTTKVKYYFYKAFIQDGDERYMISCNRNEKRDLERLQAIAKDLGIEFIKNY